MTDRRDDELIALTVAGLERRVAAADVDDRLAAARRVAVARTESPVPAPLATWIPATAMAATFLAVAALVTQLPDEALPVLDDELFAAQHLELLEDIELYAWMVELDVAAPVVEGAG